MEKKLRSMTVSIGIVVAVLLVSSIVSVSVFAAVDPATDLLPYCVAYWALNETGSTHYDYCGSHDGTENSALVDITTPTGTGQNFTGDGTDYIVVGDADDLDFPGDFSIVAGLNLQKMTAGQSHYWLGKDAATNGYGMQYSTVNGWYMSGIIRGGSWAYTEENKYGAGWFVIAHTYADTNNNISILIDGTPYYSALTGGEVSGTALDLWIGADSGGNLDWGGGIDYVYIFNKTLSQEEVQYLVEGQCVVNCSGGGDPYSLPDNVSESDWVFPATDPDTHATSPVWLNWSDSTSSIGATLNYTLYVNGTKEWSGLNTSQYEWTIPAEAHYLLRVDVQDNGTWVTGANKKFIYDTTSPTLSNWDGTINTDNSTVTKTNSLILNVTATDEKQIWSLNASLLYAGNESVLSYINVTNLTGYSYDANWTFNISSFPDGDYYLRVTAEDAHTHRLIKDYDPVIDHATRTIDYTGENDNRIKVVLETINYYDMRIGYSTLQSARGLINSFTTQQLDDRYTFIVDTSIPYNPYHNYEYEFEIECDEKIYEVDKSQWPGHLICGRNWLDFYNANSVVNIQRVNDYKVIAWVYTRSRATIFNSVGGLNSLTETLEFEIDRTAPSIGSEADMNGSAYAYSQAYKFNATITDTSGISNVFFEFNGTNYTTGVLTGNIYQDISPVSVSAGSVYSYRWHANDSLDNWAGSTARNFEVVPGTYTISFTINGTGLWTVNGGIAVSVNASGSVGTSPSLRRNGTMVSNPDDFDNVLVGIYNYTSWAGTVNWSNVSFSQVLNVTNATIVQVPPTISNVTLWSLTNTSLHKIIGNVTGADDNADNLSFFYRLYLDGVLWGSGSRLGPLGVREGDDQWVDGSGSCNAPYPACENYWKDGDWGTGTNYSTKGATTVNIGLFENFTVNRSLGFSGYNLSYRIMKSSLGGVYPLTSCWYGSGWSTPAVDWQTSTSTPTNYTLSIPANCVVDGVVQVRTIIQGTFPSDTRYAMVWDTEWLYHNNSFVQGTEYNVVNVSDASLSLGDEWVLSVRAYDGINYSDWVNSSSITITAPNISLCDASYTHAVLNFTVQDEYNFTMLNAEHTSVFEYWTANHPGTTYTSSFYLSNSSNFAYCFLQPNITVRANYQIYYEDANYPQRRYDGINATLTGGVPNATTLYLMHEDKGIYARFKTVDEYDIILSGVSVVMQKYINGTLVTAETHVTDSSGFATFWVDPNQYYYFTFTKSGYTTKSLTIRPTTTEDYTITMDSTTSTTPSSSMRGIQYYFEPDTTPLANNTEYTFYYNMTSDYYTITYCAFTLYNQSGGILQTSTDGTPSQCYISFAQNTLNYTRIHAEAVFTENGTNITLSRYYDVIDTSSGALSIQNFIDDLTAFSRSGFNDFTRMLIALVITMGIVFGVSSWFDLSVSREGDVEAVLIIITALTFLFSWMGWYTISTIPFPDGPGLASLSKYMIFYVVLLGTVGWMVNRR